MTLVTARRTWLFLSALAFLAWLSYLIYLVATARNPVVLSHSQILAADLVVVARVENREAGKVKVVEVRWSNKDKAPAVGQEITVTNLASCDWPKEPTDEYILPLSVEDGTYQVVPIPRSPGFPHNPSGSNPARVYPATPETLRQLEEIHPATP